MIGVLDLQGGVVEHLGHLAQLGIPARTVKTVSGLEGLCGLILPGGESTCLGKLLRLTGLGEAIGEAHARGLLVWGTCAGAILLARRVEDEVEHLGLIDISVRRNAFGSQLDSFFTEELVPAVSPEPIPLVFIRAPALVSPGASVRVLLEIRGWVAAAEDSQVLVTAFHPELSESLAFHRYFARKCGLVSAGNDQPDGRPTQGDSNRGQVWPRLTHVLGRV